MIPDERFSLKGFFSYVLSQQKWSTQTNIFSFFFLWKFKTLVQYGTTVLNDCFLSSVLVNV